MDVPVPTSTTGLLIFVVVAVIGLVVYLVKSQNDKIAPALGELTKAITTLPATLKTVLHEVVAEREESTRR